MKRLLVFKQFKLQIKKNGTKQINFIKQKIFLKANATFLLKCQSIISSLMPPTNKNALSEGTRNNSTARTASRKPYLQELAALTSPRREQRSPVLETHFLVDP